jgi:uncharacterized protein (DUF488 family)
MGGDMPRKLTTTVFTVGHSTRTIKEFLDILKSFQIALLIDVRHFPGSKFCPQYGQKKLEKSLAKAKIGYLHLVGLGGRRAPDKTKSSNTGWRNPQFRGYADYMQTKEFKADLTRLKELATHQVTAIMCAEAVPWRCHRSLIGDALLVQDIQVEDIFGLNIDRPHRMTAFAKVKGRRVTYPSYSL